MADVYSAPAPPAGYTGTKPLAQRVEESYFAGRKPSQEELLGFRDLLSKMQSVGMSDSYIENSFNTLKANNFDFAGRLGSDYYTNKLAQQIANQRTNLDTSKYFGGDIGAMGGIDAATQYMASLLTRSGIRDLSEIGEKVEKVPQYAPKTNHYTTGDDLQRFDNLIASGRYGQEFVPTDTESGSGYYRPARPPAGEMVDVDGKKYFVQYGEQNMGDASYTYGYLVPAEQTGTQVTTKLINKRTGEQLKQGHDASYIYSNTQNSYLDGEQADSDYTIGGSFAGGNTSLKLRMINGLPVFYSTPGPSSSDMPSPEFMSAALGMASLMFPGIGTAIGGAITGSLGIAASAAVNAAIGTGVLTTIASGGDVKKGVISGLTAYVAPAIASELGNAAGSIFDSPMGKKMFESMSASALRAAALGQDVEKAVMGAAAGEMFNVVTSQIPGFSDIKDPALKNSISQAVQAGLSAEGSFSDKVQAAALQGAVTMGLSQMKVDGKSFDTLTPSQQKIATEFLQSALTNKPLNDKAVLEAALSGAANQVKTAISAEKAGQTDLSAFDASVGLTKPATPLEDDIGFAVSPSLNVPGTAPVSTGAADVFAGTIRAGEADALGAANFYGGPRISLDPTQTGASPFGPSIGFPPVFGGAMPAFEDVGPPDMGPTIRREQIISDPNQPTRQLAPGFIPGEVPIQRETILDADKAEKTRQEISDEVFAELVKNFQEVNPSTLRLASDLALDYSSFDPNIPTPMSDMAQQNKSLIAQGVSEAYKNLTEAAPILLKLQVDANRVDQAQKTLSRFDLIDEGKLNEAIAPIKTFPLGLKVLSEYNSASPERRAEMREEQSGVIQNSVGAATEALRLYEQYKQDRNKDRIAVPEFTDIRTDNIKDLASDFSKWLQYNVGAGSVSTATVMLGALIGGPLGALAASVPMGTSEALANRMQYLSEVYKGKNPDETASSILSYLNKTGETNLIIGAASGALDLMGPVGSALRRQAGASLIKDVVERPVVGALKNVPKEMLEEAFTGAMQELTQIFGEQYLGEQEGPVFSVANGKRLINSAAAEAAGSLSGSGINIATASGAEQWKNKTIEIAKEHAADEVQAGRVLYPDVLNPATPEEASSSKRALDKLSDPATTAQVTEFDIYGSGFSEVPINKPTFGVKSSTQTLEGSTVYNLGDGYAALEDAFGGIKVINEAGRVVPLTAKEVTDLYDTVIEPYKKQQLTKEVAKPVDQVVDTTGTVVDTSGVRPTVPVDTSGTSQPTGTTPVIVTPPTGSTQPVVIDTSRPTDTTGGGTKPVVTEPTVVDTTVNKPAGTSTSTATGDTTGPSTTVVTRPDVTDTSGLSSGATVTNPNATTALEMALGKTPVDLRFDVNKDGFVSASDVLLISRGATVPQSLPADATKVGTGVVDSGATGTPTNVVSGTGSSTVVDTGAAKDAGTATSVVPGAGTGTSTGSVTDTSGTGTGAGTVVDTGKTIVVDTGKATDTGKTVVSTGTTNVSDGTGGATVVGDKTVTDTKPVVDTGKTVVTDTGGTSPVTADTTGGATVTTPAPLTEEQIRRIVNDALVANPSLSESDVKRIVGDAVSKIPGSITAADVKLVVNDAISKLPKTPTVADITNAVNLATTGFAKQSDIDLAISNIKFPSSLSREDVQGIVRTVMKENPGLSIIDVQGAINTAVRNLPPAASPSDVTRVISNTVGNPSVIDNPNTPEDESKPATGIYAVIESSQEKSRQQIFDLEKDLEKLTTEQETQRKAAEAAAEQSRQRTLLNLGTSMLGGAAGTGILGGLGALGAAPTTTALPPLKGLTTGEATKDEFVSPLAAFQKQIGLTPQQETKPEEQDRTMPYFSYGQPSEVASVLNLQDEEEQLVARGGLITPLMASGGLPVVHYAGKPRMDFRRGAYVQGPGDGQSDDIPAMLADGEYVFDAETVAALGNGSNKAGAKLLDKMREQIRAHKRGGSLKKIPPASKSPLEYLAMVKR